MARLDLRPPQGPVSSSSCRTPTADSISQPYAAPVESHRRATMTKRLHERTTTTNDGAFYPAYTEFHETNSMDYSGAVSMVAGGQPSPGFSATSETDVACPPGWNFGLVGFEMPYSSLSPGTFHPEGNVSQPQTPWGYGTEAYPAISENTVGDTLAMAGPLSPYVSVEQPAMADSMSHHGSVIQPKSGCYDSLRWAQPLTMGQISPSPSQSSYYTSSPASGAGAHYSRHNSCSSIPAPRVAGLEQARLDGRFQQVSDQAVSPVEEIFTPGGFYTGASSLYTGPTTGEWGDPRTDTISTTATTDFSTDTAPSAMPPSPTDTVGAISNQQVTQGARTPSNKRSPKTTRKKENQLAPTQKQGEADGRSQNRHQQQQSPPRPSQPILQPTRAQAQAQPTQPPKPGPAPAQARTRNRDAANKCRAKTKQAVADLEATERAMGTEHRELSATARGLRDEVLMLKNELLAHGGCDDALIQEYLTNQARKVGSGVVQTHHHHQNQQQRHRDHGHK